MQLCFLYMYLLYRKFLQYLEMRYHRYIRRWFSGINIFGTVSYTIFYLQNFGQSISDIFNFMILALLVVHFNLWTIIGPISR